MIPSQSSAALLSGLRYGDFIAFFRAMDHRLSCVLLLVLPLWLAACRDSKVAVYRIPKENDVLVATGAPAAAPPAGTRGAGNMAGLAVATTAGAALEWTAPVNWTSKPASAMRKATYILGGEGGATAELAVTAFPGDVGGDLANVNRWRGQLHLAPIAEADLAGAVTPLVANGLKMLIVDLAGGTADNPQRMLGAIVPFEGATWFFKLTGSDALVAKEKSAYLDFLRTVKASAVTAPAAVSPVPIVATVAPSPASVTIATSPADMANSVVTKAEGSELKWTVPANWQSKPASAMRKATYMIPGEEGANAELAVTAFPGSVGGELANVNRWRGQLQLPPIAEGDLAGAVSRLTVNGLAITLVELTGGAADKPQGLLGAIVPSNGANWFFKLTGPAALVAKEKPAFNTFLQTLQAP